MGEVLKAVLSKSIPWHVYHVQLYNRRLDDLFEYRCQTL